MAIRDHLICAARQKEHLCLRRDQWVYIDRPGPGGFSSALQNIVFAGQINSDVNDEGQLKAEAPPAQLYNLDIDPQQKVNVYHENPDIIEKMQSELKAHIKKGRTRR